MAIKKNKYFCRFNLKEIQLSDGRDISEIELLRTGTFSHPQAPNGRFDITKKDLAQMVINYDKNVRRLKGGEIAVDYSHDAGGVASGWIRAIELREDGNQLWITVDWTPKGLQSIQDKEFRFISADIDFEYQDNETEIMHGPVLLGAGLTNRPHIKDMEIILNEHINPNKGAGMTPEEMLKKIGELEAQVNALKAQLTAGEHDREKLESTLSESKKSVEKLKTDAEENKTKLAEVEAEKLKVKKEAKFSELV